MFILVGLWERIGSLVHESAASPVENMRHRVFIASRLVLGAVGLAFAPVFVVLYGAPSLRETAILGLLLLPFAMAMAVSRSGRLVLCQAISVVGMICFALMAGLGSASLSGPAMVWLALVPVEALFSANAALIVWSCCGAVAAVAGLHLGRLLLDVPQASVAPDHAAAVMYIAAIVYAGALALAGLKLQRVRQFAGQLNAAQYHALSHAVGDFVLRLDRSGAVVYVSSDTFVGPGLQAKDVIGRALFERVHVADRPAFLKAVADAACGKSVQPAELRVRGVSRLDDRGNAVDPVFQWVEMRVRRLDLTLAESTLHGGESVVAVLRDISQAKQHAVELEQAREGAERANYWKDRFLANISHELRTPLNAIIGFSEILASEELSPKEPAKRREYANIIHSSGEHLLAVVNSILDISKIQSGSFDILPEPFELAPLLDQCSKMVMLKAQEANIAIVHDVPTQIDDLVADKRAIKQVLINLLSNAVKFTPQDGTVTVTVRPQGNGLAISVADTGIGILAKDLARLGDPFFQARDSYDRPYEGTGLGLSVVRGLVGLHGGEMTIESALGEGTRVTVKLPLDCRNEMGAQSGRLATIHTIPRGPAAVKALPPSMPIEMVKKIA
ncbi:MAG: sensor histidine kinase [Hyphomicrobiales bacterium]|nr:sensor histidine kinase [Hyphomicrobiales bacterium]